MTGAMMRPHLKAGQRLSVLDQDVDPHQMLEFAGPMRLHMGAPMMMNHRTTIAFTKKGVYRLGTTTVEMPAAAWTSRPSAPQQAATGGDGRVAKKKGLSPPLRVLGAGAALTTRQPLPRLPGQKARLHLSN
jgi:hypothetical protein